MNNILKVLKQNVGYVALGVGMVGVFTIMAVYSMKYSKEDATQKINLDQAMEDTQEENKSIADQIETSVRVATTESTASTSASSEESLSTTETAVTTEAVASTTAKTTEEAVETSKNVSEEGIMWPMVGNVILPYSMESTVYFQTLQQYRCNPGMLIEGKVGDQVSAVSAGTIVSVEQSKEYGNVITMDIGEGYTVSYGQLNDVCVKKGQKVAAGEKIASLNEPSSYYEKEGTHLYFSMKKDDVPVNPMSVIK